MVSTAVKASVMETRENELRDVGLLFLSWRCVQNTFEVLDIEIERHWPNGLDRGPKI